MRENHVWPDLSIMSIARGEVIFIVMFKVGIIFYIFMEPD